MKKAFNAESGPSHRSVEIGVALFTAAFAILVIFGSVKAGINWDTDGPRAGFFPFYIALFILLASVVNLFSALMDIPSSSPNGKSLDGSLRSSCPQPFSWR